MERHHPEAKCEECTLYGSPYAPGYGPDSASIVVIGEAPGYREAKEGKPFVGPSGRLLDTVLVGYQIRRDEVYVDNVCACRPADNRTPTRPEMEACWPRARSEIEKRTPETIIALGNTAAQTVLSTREGITATRVGPPKQSPQFPGVRIIPTFHPAACLYAADTFPNLVTDIGKAVNPIHVSWEKPTITIIEDVYKANMAVKQLQESHDEMTIDIEVGIDSERHFGHPEQYKMLCIGISYKPGFVVVFGENVCANRGFEWRFANLLRDKKWICHNGKFDIAGLLGYCKVLGHLHFDTMLASYVLDERPGTHGLKYLAQELLGAPPYADEISKYVTAKESYAIIPRPVLYEYNAYDAHCTMMLYEHYKKEMDEEQRKLHDFLVTSSLPLMLTEKEGIGIDLEYSDQLVDQYLGVLAPLEEELSEWVVNPRSPKQVGEALHEMGFRVSSTDEEHLKNIIARSEPGGDAWRFCTLMLRHRREQKLYGTYVKGIRKRIYRNRIHSTFLLHGTTTGRLASRNPNLFNIPRESAIRKQFVPDDGNTFVQADYRTIELRAMAVEGRDTFLASIFKEGRDIHDEFSLLFYGPDFTKDQRVRTKAFVYGSAYGREPFSIAQEYGISTREAEANQQIMFDMMPGIVKWREDIRNTILNEGDDLVTRFGRHRRFWLITNDNAKDVVKEGLAFVPQSTAADIQQHAFNKLRMEHGLATRVSVYDSILVECPSDDAPDVADLMVRVMEETATELMGDEVPFPVDIKYGRSWGDV